MLGVRRNATPFIWELGELAERFGEGNAVLSGTTDAFAERTLAMRFPVTDAALRPMPRSLYRSKDRVEPLRVTGPELARVRGGTPAAPFPATFLVSQRVPRFKMAAPKGLINKPPLSMLA
mmetsp:Transcript_33597/g.79537  ORF Transcript_33597/g.79537 Transcript_33597/m.79537 type:complete len:120 (-) Transcript_33597:172-531(-)